MKFAAAIQLKRRTFLTVVGASLCVTRTGFAELIECPDYDRFAGAWFDIVARSKEANSVKAAWLRLILASQAHQLYPEAIAAALDNHLADARGLRHGPRSCSEACGWLLDIWRSSPVPASERRSIFRRRRFRRKQRKALYQSLRLIIGRSQYASVNDRLVLRLASRQQRSLLETEVGDRSGKMLRIQGEAKATQARYLRHQRAAGTLERESGVDVAAELTRLHGRFRSLAGLRDDMAHKLAYAASSGHFRCRHLLGNFACSRRVMLEVGEKACLG